MIYLAIYLIHFFDTLRITAQALIAMSAFILFAYALYVDGEKEKIAKAIKIIITTISIAILTLIFIPTKETMYQLGAIYIGKQLNTTIQVDKKLEKVSKIVDLKLDEIIKKEQ